MQDHSNTGGTATPKQEQAGVADHIARDLSAHTDMANAARLAHLCGETLIWVEGRGWLEYDGKRWTRCSETAMKAKAMAVVRYMVTDAIDEVDHDLLDWAFDSQHVSRIRAMVDLAAAYLPVDADRLDTDSWLLNVDNGTVDLRTGKLALHRRQDFITRVSPAAYDPDSACPIWDSFLVRVFDGDDDLIGYVRRAVGASLVGEGRDQVFFVLFGTGANGKTTFIEVIHDLLGDYARKVPVDVFMEKRPGTIPVELAQLPGVRLVSAVESDVDQKIAAGIGTELRCPQVDDNGGRNGWYDLVTEVSVGDVVYHWNALEHRFVGRSVVAEDCSVDQYGDRVVLLHGFTPLPVSIGLDEVRDQRDAIYAARDSIRSTHPDGPLFLPFQFRKDGLRMMSNYFAKWPAQLVTPFFGDDGMAERHCRQLPRKVLMNHLQGHFPGCICSLSSQRPIPITW